MPTAQHSKPVLIAAWAAVLAVTLANIILQEIFDYPLTQTQEYAIQAGIVTAGLALAFIWPALRPLRPFFGLFLVVALSEWFVYTRVDTLPFYRAWLHSPSFAVWLPAEKSLGLLVTGVVIAFLFLLKRQRQRFFLARGDLSAPVEPVRWLAIGPGVRWNRLGLQFAVYLSLGTLAFLVIAGRPPLDIVVRALPFLPTVLLAAALNAFNEEVTYKASFLSVLEDVVGKQQSLWLLAAYFGILHYYGIPYGVVGVLLAGFLGWFLGKSMLETRGLFWAWFLHFLQDVWIFAFLAIGSITPGG